MLPARQPFALGLGFFSVHSFDLRRPWGRQAGRQGRSKASTIAPAGFCCYCVKGSLVAAKSKVQVTTTSTTSNLARSMPPRSRRNERERATASALVQTAGRLGRTRFRKNTWKKNFVSVYAWLVCILSLWFGSFHCRDNNNNNNNDKSRCVGEMERAAAEQQNCLFCHYSVHFSCYPTAKAPFCCRFSTMATAVKSAASLCSALVRAAEYAAELSRFYW